MQARHDVIGDVRGRGAMCAIELVSDRATKEPADEVTSAVAKRCLENGLIALSAGTYNNVLRLLPPLTIEDPLLDEGLAIVDEALGAVGR
jgi:4-aminobutyrate aminotransferase / (S)-3-amino-2-methylpropionate transaminase / 5-aminovalerate transaminase